MPQAAGTGKGKETAEPSMSIEPIRRRDAVLLAVAFEGGLVLLALLLGCPLRLPPLEQTHGNARDLGWGVAATVPLLLGFWACVRWPVGPLARIKRFSEEFIAPFFGNCTAL